MSPYVYVGDNPETYTDPTGHCAFCIVLPILAAVGEAVVDVAVAVVAAPEVITAALFVGIFVLGALIINNVLQAKRVHEDNPKHGTKPRMTKRGVASPKATNPVGMLDDAIKVSADGKKWVAYDPDTGEIIVYSSGDGGKTFHSHQETWKELQGDERVH